jgi:hypothetical protein
MPVIVFEYSSALVATYNITFLSEAFDLFQFMK